MCDTHLDASLQAPAVDTSHVRMEVVYGGWKPHLGACQSCKDLGKAISELCKQLLKDRRLCRRSNL